ncbi:TPA: hypothetical protein MFA45_001379 [Klebsiella pneumoniae]|mgnify:FL=1|uniref:hypothetical protein n=1 Tax=Klebsiella pneumoniae TaxID=573 RepID=UPI0004997CE8|nr:hypothetical protein [Klebsiella pneumoniae]HDU4951333.1 hypothetical protein [Klebsiella pneumoniae subsp. pneumoniae]AIA43433.1 hypothetical protein KPNIH27_19520 [Klebsiella pneumoniae subsp. pneumoniae KPNIH27]ELA2734934.1 hypothetical protein [Klebsiella pneumoniae]ELA2740296.1 hypothetical protein [Klebsiella pneumoniae]MBE0199828.1 hypothetical protein [Klebsiella pneumoniae]
MWKYSNIQFSDALSAVNCSVVPAHPWIYGLGQQTENGLYLSPSNAVAWLARQLASTGSVSDVVIVLVTGDGHDDFMANIDGLVSVLPVPAMMQVKRLAQSAALLATEKMVIPGGMETALPSAIAFTPATLRAALNAKTVATAQQAAGAGVSLDGMKSALEGFISQRAQLLNDMASGLEALKGKSAQAWTFVASGDVATTLAGLARDIPAASAVHCAAVMLAGEDLQGIRSLIHDIDPDTGA